LVIDGGSCDATVVVAADWGARVLQAPRGRGAQLAVGGAAAVGDWLLFLHADTQLGPGWVVAARAFMAQPGSEQRAAAFRLALDDSDPRARRIERLANWRGRALGLPYGDQGLLISRSIYEALGGYRPLPLMEDVDLVRRIGRRRIVILDAAAVTSAARYRRDGWWLRPLRNLALLGLYFLGVPTRVLHRLYA
jgi:rSAM/selenodomain-associated transferase 2